MQISYLRRPRKVYICGFPSELFRCPSRGPLLQNVERNYGKVRAPIFDSLGRGVSFRVCLDFFLVFTSRLPLGVVEMIPFPPVEIIPSILLSSPLKNDISRGSFVVIPASSSFVREMGCFLRHIPNTSVFPHDVTCPGHPRASRASDKVSTKKEYRLLCRTGAPPTYARIVRSRTAVKSSR